MIHGVVLGALHQFVDLLLYPVLAALALAVVMTLWELGLMLAERFVTLPTYAEGCQQRFGQYASRRLERSDLLARGGPILGLMGTLIPLGPGLTALGSGNLDMLTTALTVAFDTTVVGLLVGLITYCISRVRRRWYEHTWTQLTESSSHEAI
ncbi:MAG: MotA/TolQ/ExbB proton channel family protein [Motiliproteus sp.]